MKNYIPILIAIWILGAAAQAVAVEDGLGTNHVRTLRAYDGIVLDGLKITNWTGVSASTLTNGSITTGMLQDAAVTADKMAAAVAGDGLTGGAGSPLAVNPGDGLSIVGDAVGVDATVVRTSGVQTIAGTNTFTGLLHVPAPTADTHAATKLYVDDAMSSSLATGTSAGQTLRWDGSVWTNHSGLTADAGGNVAVGANLRVTGIQTNVSDLVVQGDASVVGGVEIAGGLVVSGVQTNESDLEVEGNLQVDGTVSIEGRATLNGQWVLTPNGTPGSPLNIVAGTGISNITRAYVVIQGSGGPVTVTANPRISTTGAVAGQMITLQGGSDANWVRLDNANGLVLAGGISFTLKQGHIIQFIYDGSVWRETFRTVPSLL